MNLIKRAGVYRELAILTAMLILTALLSFPARAEEAESQHEHVRVGFFAMDGYHMMDEDGNRSGYGYDFLRLMARYWDADYEYIGYDKSWEDMQQMLLNGEIDILVCTTLIETGIDVRNCNTLIIEDADRMGLAQLYQIRGRVGRSGRKAYAYFTFRRDKTLTDIAQKRLSAIREFTAFGSGFRIAMRDLQIRGAGSLLGHSQHGHMEAVGYDLYVKMLGQAIARAKGEPVQRDKSECLVDLRVDAFIPEKYIPDGAGRIEAYKRIAAIQTPEDAADVLDELIDRYGDPPPSVSDLVNVSLVRVQAAAVGVYEVTQKKDTLVLNLETLELAMIRGLLQAFNGRVTAGAGSKPYLSVVLQPDEKPLELLQNILKAMADILTGTEREKAPQTGGAGTRKRD